MQRTECNCDMCQAGCRAMPGYLVPEDLPFFDVKDLAASEGAVAMKDGKQVQIPTLVPKQNPDGSCIFYTADGRCAVHNHSPYGCRMFSICDKSEPDQRVLQSGLVSCYKDMQAEGPYTQAISQADPARPRSARKAALHQLLDRIEARPETHGMNSEELKRFRKKRRKKAVRK